ncbi:MAG: Gfo/Idh/MocA family oxidoreductase [Actinobacteria bacterium]|nr:Gfo/Idh/MocA family oxidoreductase [Actinomycetota bacterium]
MNQPSPPRRLRAAVVGTGGISKEHLGYLSAAAGVDLVGVCDRSPAAVAYAAERYATRPFADVAEMLAATSPDVTHILTPPATHVALSTLALHAGSHVICEKPITPTAPQLRDLLAVADAAGRVVTENHNYRFNPEVAALDELLASGKLGTLSEVEVRICLPVTDPAGRFGDPNLPSPIHQLPAGVIHDFMTHFAYLVNHFASETQWTTVLSAWNGHGGFAHIPVDDLDAILVGQRADGPVHARIRFSAVCGPDEFEITVRGTEGWAQSELFGGRWTEMRPRKVGAQLSSIANLMVGGATMFFDGPRSFKRKIMQEGPYVGLARYLDETYAALATGAPVPVGPSDMMAASELIDRLVAGRSASEVVS